MEGIRKFVSISSRKLYMLFIQTQQLIQVNALPEH